MGATDSELVLFYLLLASGLIFFLTLLYGLFRSPPGCKTKKNTEPGKPASQAS